jgi:tetratricopeptide (TPR) repeat protein
MSRNPFRALRVLLLAGIVAAASMDSIASAQADAIKDRLNRVSADLFSRTDRISDAIRELKAILALDPNLAEAHFLLGMAYRMAGAGELVGESIAELRQSLALNPGLVPARFYLAQLYLDLGRPQRAREELEAALSTVPENTQLLAMLGETERQLKNPTRSVELIRQALKADESFAQGRYYLALALLDLGRREEAVHELERVVQSDPKVPEPYVGLGAVYIDMGRFDEALKVLDEGTRIDPARADTRIQLARAYRSKGLLAKADEQLKLAMPQAAAAVASPFAQQQQVEFELYLELGLLRQRQGQLDAAVKAFQKALDMDPDHAAAKRYLADARKLLRERLQKKKAGESR